jgi:hypothetical protein
MRSISYFHTGTIAAGSPLFFIEGNSRTSDGFADFVSLLQKQKRSEEIEENNASESKFSSIFQSVFKF